MREIDKCSVAAVVVTYNRKELLRQCLHALLSQTRPLDEIIVVDNASTDGTDHMISAEFPQITYVRLPENIGGAGGFHEGMKLAYEKGYDWIWLMDDDAFPYNDALQHLVRQIENRLKNGEFNFCLYSVYVGPDEVRFSEPITVFVNGQKYTYLHFDDILKSRVLQGIGGPFLGPLIPSHAIARVGLPRKDTFIWGDYEYFQRLRDGGFTIYYDFRSKIRHPIHDYKSIMLPIGMVKLKPPIWRRFNVPLGPPWKQYYGVRNEVFFATRYGKGGVGILKAILAVVVKVCILVLHERGNRLEMMRWCLRGVGDGLRGRMGIGIKPAPPINWDR